jgi:hypothetical protein
MCYKTFQCCNAPKREREPRPASLCFGIGAAISKMKRRGLRHDAGARKEAPPQRRANERRWHDERYTDERFPDYPY